MRFPQIPKLQSTLLRLMVGEVVSVAPDLFPGLPNGGRFVVTSVRGRRGVMKRVRTWKAMTARAVK